jgi:hypothetical protein
MCIDPKGQRLSRFAVCSCGAYFPECDYRDMAKHNEAGMPNHKWVYIHEDWRRSDEKDSSIRLQRRN